MTHSACCNLLVSSCRILYSSCQGQALLLWGLPCCLGMWNIKQALESNLLIVPLHVEMSAEAVPNSLPRVWAACPAVRREIGTGHTRNSSIQNWASPSNRYKTCGCRHTGFYETLLNLASWTEWLELKLHWVNCSTCALWGLGMGTDLRQEDFFLCFCSKPAIWSLCRNGC